MTVRSGTRAGEAVAVAVGVDLGVDRSGCECRSGCRSGSREGERDGEEDRVTPPRGVGKVKGRYHSRVGIEGGCHPQCYFLSLYFIVKQ